MIYFEYNNVGKPTGRTSDNPCHGFVHFCAVDIDNVSEALIKETDGSLSFSRKALDAICKLFQGVEDSTGDWIVQTNEKSYGMITKDGKFLRLATKTDADHALCVPHRAARVGLTTEAFRKINR